MGLGTELALTGVRIVDPERERVSEPLTVAIADGRVIYAGPTVVGDSTATVETDGRYATAGLIDMHVHLCHESRAHLGISFSHGESEALAEYRTVQNLAEMQQHGVALVRDVGGRDRPIRNIARVASAREMTLPDVESAGVPFCIEGGHGSEFGRWLAPDSDVDALMGAHSTQGHTWVKVMNGPEVWSDADLARLVRAAHAAGLKTAVHAFTDEGVWSALRAECDTIEHCFASSPEMVAAAISAGTSFVPTAFAARTSLGTRFRGTMPPEEVAHLEAWRDYLEGGLATHLASGLPALIGTDAGCAPCQPQDVVDEMEQLQSWGFPSSHVLAWATSVPARLLGREDHGSISQGRWASFMLSDENPLDSVSNLRNPTLVMAKGVPVRDNLGLNHA